MKFIAVDVETANADMASICSIGAATFENGKLSSEWYSLVNPDDYFDPVNISIHGIDESMVASAPTYRVQSRHLMDWIDFEPVRFFGPALADELVRRKAFEGLEPLGEVVGVDESGEMLAKPVMG